MVTDPELAAVMPKLPQAKRAQYLPLLQAAMQEFEINSYLREAAFIAQLAHESLQLKHFEEIADGHAYEGRRDLGNVKPGDGRRYKGRGPIQLTGRANYRRYGKLLGLDLEGNPVQAADPKVGFRIAGLYWQSHGLNALADARKFKTITRRINGGVRGYEDRLRYYQKALQVLSKGDAVPAPVEDDPEEPVALVADQKEVTREAFLDADTCWAPLRVVTEFFDWAILDVEDDEAQVQTLGGAHRVPMQIRGGRGFSPIRDLARLAGMNARWDAGSRTVRLER